MTSLIVHAPGSLEAVDDLEIARSAIVGALPGSASHELARAEMLAFIDAHPDALHRSCVAGHLTGSALVVDPSTRHVLLLFHAKVQRWLQPGGHADGDGNLAHVALRETQEETGIEALSVVTPAIDLDIHVFRSAAGHEPDHLHLDVRHLVLAPAGAVATSNHESEGLAWVAFDDLVRFDVDPGTLRMAAAGLTVVDCL